MAYSYTAFTGNGSTTQYAVSFPYIRREHVAVTVAGVPSAFTWVNNSLIQMDAAPANGAAVRVYRTTPIDAPLVDFADGATLVAADLDTNSRQSIYIQQELDDAQTDNLPNVIPNGNKGDITTSVGGTVWAINNGAVTEAKIAAGAVTEAKLGTGAITETKIGTGAVTSTKILDGTILNADINASAGITAGKLSFTQAGTGAVARTVESKLKDTVSIFDFIPQAEHAAILARTSIYNCTTDIQAAIDSVGTSSTLANKGGEIWFPAGSYKITATINARTGVKLSGVFGDIAYAGQTSATGSKLVWAGANSSTILSVYAVRFFTLDGLFIDAGTATGMTGILLDTNNVPSGAMNTFERFFIYNCLVAVQWGTTGISAGSKQNDGTIFRQFFIISDRIGSKGFVLNSGNSAQYSTIENGGIQVDDIAVDIVVTNQLQLRRVVSGYATKTAFCRISTGINILIEGCESENQGTRTDGRISSGSCFIKIIAPIESYPVADTTIVLNQNTINNPIIVEYPVTIVSTGDAWGVCYTGVSTVVPSTGTFTNGVSNCVAINNGAAAGRGWIASQYVTLKQVNPRYALFQEDKLTQPGYANVQTASTANAGVNVINAVDSRSYGGQLWSEISTGTGSAYGVGKRIWETGGTKEILTLSNDDVTIGKASTSTRLRFAQLENIPTATTAGTVGQVIADTAYIYVCVGTNTWKRVAIATW